MTSALPWALLAFLAGVLAHAVATPPAPDPGAAVERCQVECTVAAAELAQEAWTGTDRHARALQIALDAYGAQLGDLADGCSFWSRDRIAEVR